MAEKIVQRIDGILRLICTVQKRLDGVTYDEFCKSGLLADATAFSISQIGERMIKLEELLALKYPDFPWKQARNMRNIIVHDYDNVNFPLIYKTATEDLKILKQKFFEVKDDINDISKDSLTTDRLTIKPWDDYDADELFELAKEPEIAHWCGFEPHKHIRDTLFVLHNFLEIKESYAICLKETRKVIGSIQLKLGEETDLTDKDDECELGIWIGKPFQRNGYAFEAINELLRHAFEDLNMSVVWYGYYEGNVKSEKLQQKLGFVYHHSSPNIELKHLDETRVGHVSYYSKEMWLRQFN